MIARALHYELVGLRRSGAVPLTVLFAAGGSLLGRTITWLASVAQTYEIDQFLSVDSLGVDVSVSLALLAYVIATAYVFGRDLSDGTAEVVLTAPVSRESVVFAKLAVLLVWVLGLAVLAAGADVLLRALLALTSVHPGAALPSLGTAAAALAAFATMPLFGWAALRFRGMAAASGAGIAINMAAFSLGGYEFAAALPWTAPYALAAGESSAMLLVGPLVVFLLGVAACLWQVRRLDLT